LDHAWRRGGYDKEPAEELRRNVYLSGPHSKIFIVYFSDRAPTAGFRLSLTVGAIHELPLQHLAPAESHSFSMCLDQPPTNLDLRIVYRKRQDSNIPGRGRLCCGSLSALLNLVSVAPAIPQRPFALFSIIPQVSAKT